MTGECTYVIYHQRVVNVENGTLLHHFGQTGVDLFLVSREQVTISLFMEGDLPFSLINPFKVPPIS